MTVLGASSKATARQLLIAALTIFLVALGVRLLIRQDARVDAPKVQSGVVADYQRTAHLINESGLRGLFDPNGPLADPNLLGHPPGYPIVRSVIARIFGDSNNAMQFFQIACDALAAVLVFLIAFELFSFAPAVIAGLLVSFAPQFAWNSVLLLPDTLAVLPLLLALLLLIRALRRPRLVLFIAVGLLLGISCWLRANAMLIAPFFAVASALLLKAEQRLRFAGALLLAAVVTIGILTARNWIVYQHFIPVSLGAGQTLLEGIADYDSDKRFGIPETDMGIMKMESEEQNRPDYYSSLFSPDGVKRERARLARGFGIIARNPGWFLSVIVRRAASMLRLERARNVSPTPPFSQSFTSVNARLPDFETTATPLLDVEEKSAGVNILPSADGRSVRIVTDESKYGPQLRWKPFAVLSYHDYVLRVPVRVEDGRVFLEVVGTGSGQVHNIAVLETLETKDGVQPIVRLELPFASFTDGSVNVVLKNGSARSGRSIIEFGAIEIQELGPTSFTWTRYPRLIVANIQRLFITAWMLPLAVLGIVFVARARHKEALILSLVVPVYYLCVQSFLHTEYRYVLAIHYFLFVFVAVALHQAVVSSYWLISRATKRQM